jgi:PTH1 family peptidyl-tRNA hydrolase
VKLIVGLGNPGEKYTKTRHNTGFLVVNKIAEEKDVVLRLENEFKSIKGDFNIGEERIMLIEPQTFMNNSGEAVKKLRNYYKLDTEDIIVIHDDVDLEPCKIKIQLGGSSAGHKGVQSIIDSVGTEEFWRIRVGVGKSDKIPTEEWVLMNFEKDVEVKLTEIIDFSSNIVLQSASNGFETLTENI